MIEDQDNREKISKLLRFFSSHTTEQADGSMTSFEQYISRYEAGVRDNYQQIFRGNKTMHAFLSLWGRSNHVRH